MGKIEYQKGLKKQKHEHTFNDYAIRDGRFAEQKSVLFHFFYLLFMPFHRFQTMNSRTRIIKYNNCFLVAFRSNAFSPCA